MELTELTHRLRNSLELLVFRCSLPICCVATEIGGVTNTYGRSKRPEWGELELKGDLLYLGTNVYTGAM